MFARSLSVNEFGKLQPLIGSRPNREEDQIYHSGHAGFSSPGKVSMAGKLEALAVDSYYIGSAEGHEYPDL